MKNNALRTILQNLAISSHQNIQSKKIAAKLLPIITMWQVENNYTDA